MLQLTNSKDCEAFLRDKWEEDTLSEQELIYCVYLDKDGERKNFERIGQCRYSEATVDFYQVIKHAIAVKSRHVVIAHNHPCGDPRPSEGDKILTKRLYDFLDMAQITLEDHIILTEHKYFSFKDNGLLGQVRKTG